MNRELIKRAQNGDEQARETMVIENIPLVKHIVKKFVGRGVEWDDLFQLGSLGLLKAIDAFDLSYDVRFSTYAVPVIMGEIRRFLRDDGQVKVSRTLKENAVRIHHAIEALRGDCGAEPSIEAVAARVSLSIEEVTLALESGRSAVSLDQPVMDGELRLMDVVPDNKADPGDRIMLKMLLQTLPVKERQLILMRYFQDKTQTEIAAALDMTQVQVSRLERKVLEKMRVATG